MTWRDVKNRARRTLHEIMQVDAYYFTSLPPESDEEPLEVDVRVHTSDKALGDQPGTSYQFAERHEGVVTLILMCEQVTPHNGGVVSISANEAYIIDNVHPVDGITVTVEVSRITGDDLNDLTFPGEESDSDA